jgi:hypothetical protein
MTRADRYALAWWCLWCSAFWALLIYGLSR